MFGPNAAQSEHKLGLDQQGCIEAALDTVMGSEKWIATNGITNSMIVQVRRKYPTDPWCDKEHNSAKQDTMMMLSPS